MIRPGRVDRKVELGHATPDQARRLFLWFYQGCGVAPGSSSRLAERFAAQVPRGKTCMAAIQEHLLRHRGAPDAAAHEVVFDEQSLDPRLRSRAVEKSPSRGRAGKTSGRAGCAVR